MPSGKKVYITGYIGKDEIRFLFGSGASANILPEKYFEQSAQRRTFRTVVGNIFHGLGPEQKTITFNGTPIVVRAYGKKKITVLGEDFTYFSHITTDRHGIVSITYKHPSKSIILYTRDEINSHSPVIPDH